MVLFELAAITDEASEDLEEALACLQAEGLQAVELRSLWGANIADLSPAQVDRARTLLRDKGMRVVSIASPFLKCNAPGRPDAPTTGDTFGARAGALEEHWEILERSLAMCAAFDAPILRCFSFWRLSNPEQAWPAAREALSTALARCLRAGVTLGLENEGACTIGTGSETAGFLTSSPDLAGLTVIWDPGNAAALGEIAYPDGYATLRTAGLPISHVHVKDLARAPEPSGHPRFVPTGDGTIDYPGQLVALARDGYQGLLSLEPHVHQGQEGMRRCIAGLRAALVTAEQQLAAF